MSASAKFDKTFFRRLCRDFEDRGAHPLSLIVLLIVGVFGYYSNAFTGVLVVVMTCVSVYEVLRRMNDGVPLMQVAALIAVLQWICGPWLTYNVNLLFGHYGMRVDSQSYFGYAIPGTVAFVLGLLACGAFGRQRALLRGVDRSSFVGIGLILAVLGFAGGLAMEFVPSGLAFVFYLVSQLRYVGAIYFLYSTSPLRWILAVIAVVPLLSGSAESGMFHDLLLWFGILVCYWYATKARKLRFAALLLIVGIAVAFTIQGIKRSYREKVWNEEEGSLVTEVRDFWSSPHRMFSEDVFTNVIIRMNQGWIVAAVMQHVPLEEPYAMGDTIEDAIEAALIPRVLSEEKTMAGGRENFQRFTGLFISEDTSMGLSLLGELYANVGPDYGIIIMVLFGGGISFWHGLCVRCSMRYPTFYFWVPVVFSHAIRAETDAVTVLNHITKSYDSRDFSLLVDLCSVCPGYPPP